MANPLFNLFNNSGNNNMARLIQQFNQFKQGFSGNPMQAREQVQQMLNSGRVTQAQYNQAVQMANMLQGMLK